jgi:hypothetical protein
MCCATAAEINFSIFHHPLPKKPTSFTITPHSLPQPPQPQTTSNLLFVFVDFLFWRFHINRNMQHMTSRIWILSLNRMLSRLICVVVCISLLLLFMAK